MTRLQTIDLTPLHRATVGFDQMFRDMDRMFENSKSINYPPYNVIELNENEWLISVAVAGFAMENLDITLEKNMLTIEGTTPSTTDDVKYLHKGIGGRNFRRQFALADHIEVVDANLSLGVLNIRLKKEVPEELQPKKIEIKTGPEFTLTVDQQ